MKEFFIVLGAVIAIVTIWYIIARLRGTRVVLQTTLAKATDKEIEADQYYYLPGFSMTINAKLTLVISRSFTSRKITDISQTLDLDTQTQVEPDTEQLLILNYHQDLYSEDEIRITTSADALIENVSVVTHDRIDSIIAQLTAKVPQDQLITKDFTPKAEPIVKETVTFTKTFKISVKELKNEIVTCPWVLSFDNPGSDPVSWNASFSIKNESMKNSHQLASVFTFDGILSRPLQTKTWEVLLPEDPLNTEEKTTKYGTKSHSSFTAMVPDPTRIIKIPIKRNLFIKKSQVPKFSKGILIENYFDKPSEMEALVSIPVNIAKAIISIPSALLQFKITNVKREVEYEKASSELQKLRNPVPAAPAPTGSNGSGTDSQKKNETPEVALKDRKEKAGNEEGTAPKLGKLPAEEGATPTGKLKDLQEKLIIKDGTPADTSTVAPESCFWHSRFTGDWMSYNNEKVMNCVPAAAAHMIMCWTCNTKPNPTRLTLQQVIDAYTRESGYDPVTGANDRGCSTLKFLLHWRTPGVDANKIQQFIGLDRGDKDELKLAISLFGSCMVGFKMPNSAKDQKDFWAITDPNNQQGEWGPHAVAAIGYDSDSLLIVSWGRIIKVKWDFYEKYNDEGFAVLTDDWIKEGKSPNGHDIATLKSMITDLA